MGLRFRYSDVLAPLIEPSEEELAQERQDKIAEENKKQNWVQLSPENAEKLKSVLEEQKGKSDYWNNPEGLFTKFAAPAIQAHIKSTMEGHEQDPLGITYYDAGKMPGATEPSKGDKKPRTPDNPSEWFDPKTGKVDYDAFKTFGMPQETKREISTEILSKILKMPKAPIEEGHPEVKRETDSGLVKLSKDVWQLADGIAGQLPTSVGLSIWDYATGKAKSYKPEEILSSDELAAVKYAHMEGKPQQLNLGAYGVYIDPRKSLAEVMKDTSAEKIRLAWDMLREDTDRAIMQDANLALMFAPALKAVKPVEKALKAAKVAKAVDVVDAISNPLSATLKPSTAAGRIATAAAEGAIMQPLPQSTERLKEQGEARAVGAATGGIIGGIGEVVAQGIGHLIEARQTEKHLARVAKIDTIEKVHPLEDVVTGKVVPEIPIDDVDKKMIANRVLLKQTGITPQSDGREVAEALSRGTKDPVVRQLIDTQMSLMGTSVAREKNIMDLKSAMRDVKSSKDIPNAKEIVNNLELAIGKDGTPAAGADPYLVNSLSGDSESFRAAVSEIHPELAGILEKVSGRTTDDTVYALQFNRMMRQLFPENSKDVASAVIRDARNPDILEAHQHWAETEIKDVNTIRKQVFATSEAKKKLVEIGMDINSIIDHIRQSYITPKDLAPSYLDDVSRALKGRRFAPEKMEAAKHASEKLYNTVERAMESGTPIDNDFLKEIRGQFGGTIHKDLMDALEGQILRYNRQQQVLAKKSRSIYSYLTKRTFVESQRQRARYDTVDERNLNEIYSSRDNVDTRLHEKFIRPIKDSNLPIETVNVVLEHAPVVAESMSAGVPIPSEVLNNIAAATQAIISAKREIGKPPLYVKAMKEFNDSLQLYNKQVRALQMVEARALESLDDLTKAPQTILMLNRMGEVISNPVLMDKLEVIQAIASHSIGKLFTNLDLPEGSKMNMVHALIGDTATKLQMYGNGDFVFDTQSHILNVFEAMKFINKETLNRIDEVVSAAVGYPMNREFFMGMYLNPLNLDGKDNMLVEFGMDPKKAEAAAQWWTMRRDRSNRRFYNVPFFGRGPGYYASKVAGDTLLPMIYEANLLQAFHREAGKFYSDKYHPKIEEIARFRELHPTPQFSLGYYKLNGSKGMFDFFFITKLNTGFEMTPLGRIHYEMFVNQNELTRDVLYRKDREGFFQLLWETKVLEDETKAREVSNHLYNYFQDSRIQDMTALSWQNIWKFAEESHNLRLELYKDVVGILERHNKELAQLGLQVPAPQWREAYVYVPKKAHNLDLEVFTNTLYRDFESGRYFHSSEHGQIAKAQTIELGYNNSGFESDMLQDPILDLLGYVRGNLSHAYETHIRLKMEEVGTLQKDLGFDAAANWMFSITRDVSTSPIDPKWVGMNRMISRWMASRTNPSLRALVIGLRPFSNALLKASQATLTLARPASNLRNALQQHIQTALATGSKAYKIPLKFAESFARWIPGIVRDAERPSMALPAPMSKALERSMRGVQDAADRSRMDLLLTMLESAKNATKEKSPGSKLAFGFAKGEAAFVDWWVKQIKERNEVGLSRAQMEMGARAYVDMIRTIQEDGPQKAYLDLSESLPEAQRSNIWEFVRNAEERLSKGEAYGGLEFEFLHFWHSQTVGRFGIYAVPGWVAKLSSMYPAAFRFWAPRFNNIDRYADTITEKAEVMADWVRKSALHPNWKDVPKTQRAHAGYALLYGMSFAAILQVLEGGAGIFLGQSIVNQIRAEHKDDLTRRALEGTGVDLRNLGPVDYSNLFSIAQSYATSRSGIIPVEIAYNIKAVQQALNNYHDLYYPESQLINTEIARLDAERKKFDIGSPSENRQYLLEATDRYEKAVQKFRETSVIRLVDYLLESIPPTTLLPILSDPLMTSFHLMELPNLRYESIVNVKEWKGGITDTYNLVMGTHHEKLPTFNETDLAVMKQYLLDGGASEEEASMKVKQMKAFRDALVEGDEILNYLNWSEEKSFNFRSAEDRGRDFTRSMREKTKETGTIRPRPEIETIELEK